MTTYSVTQDGQWSPLIPLWDDNNVLIIVGGVAQAWGVFHFTNIPTDTIPTALSLTLRQANLPGQSAGTIEAYAVVGRFGAPNATTIPAYLLSLMTTFPAPAQDAVVTIPLPIEAPAVAGWRGSNGTFTAVLRTASAASFMVAQALEIGYTSTLDSTEMSDRTGLEGHRYLVDWERGRGTGGLVCPKTGREIARTEAVRDGYTGQLVAPEAWDPPEPRPMPWHGWEDPWES